MRKTILGFLFFICCHASAYAQIPGIGPLPIFGLFPPSVSGLSVATGPATGGTSVTITGTNFSGVTAVNFGGNAAASYTVNSTTSISATSPAGVGVVLMSSRAATSRCRARFRKPIRRGLFTKSIWRLIRCCLKATGQ